MQKRYYVKKLTDFNHRFKTKEEAEEFLRKVMGPRRRTLVGKEREQVWLLIQMMEPVRESNNQRTWTEEYIIGEKYYDVTYFSADEEPEIDEVERDKKDIL